MLFLLNTVVVKVQLRLELPSGLESMIYSPPEAVLKAGCQLYAQHPRLEYDKPDIARWYCTLMQQKFPAAGAALFYRKGNGYVGWVADVSLADLSRYWGLQNRGVDIGPDVRGEVWAKPKLVA